MLCHAGKIPFHHFPWVPPAWLCFTVNVDSFDGIWPQLQACLLLQVWPTKQCPPHQGQPFAHLCQRCRLTRYAEPAD